MDGRVVPTVCAELVGVGRPDGNRCPGELDRIVAQRAYGRGEVRGPVVVGCVLRDRFGCALGTEVVGVGPDSVVAVVLTRDDDGEQLTLLP